jgi:hypothetical protein
VTGYPASRFPAQIRAGATARGVEIGTAWDPALGAARLAAARAG